MVLGAVTSSVVEMTMEAGRVGQANSISPPALRAAWRPRLVQSVSDVRDAFRGRRTTDDRRRVEGLVRGTKDDRPLRGTPSGGEGRTPVNGTG
jgi:hypothetical protein